MFKAAFPRIGLVALIGVAVFAAGVSATWLWYSPTIPKPLSAPTVATKAPVVEQEYADARSVALDFTWAPATPLTIGVAGRVTATTCSAGVEIASGTSFISVDGQPLVALYTSIPLWRDLKDGDHGEDVRSLQTALTRLGDHVASDGTVGPATLSAVTKLFKDAGDNRSTLNTVPVSRFIWLPATSATIASCEAQLGSNLESTATVGTVSAGLMKVSLEQIPGDLVPGARTLTFDSVAVPIGDDGVIADSEALSQLAATPAAAMAKAAAKSPPDPDTKQITGRVSLTNPVRIGTVPPTAVYSISGDRGCISSSGKGYPVTIVGSQLGQTYILIRSDHVVTTVDVSKETRPSCT